MYYNNQGDMNYQVQLNEAQNKEKKALFMNCSKLGIILLLYNVFNSLFLNLFYIWVYNYKNTQFSLSFNTAIAYLRNNEQLVKSSTFSMAGNFFIIFFSFVSISIIAKYILKVNFNEMMIFRKGQVKQSAKWFPACMTVNVAASLIIAYFTLIMNNIGVSVPEVDLSINQPSTIAVVLQIAYVIVLGPIAEEVLYRGIILTLLKPFGKFLAVFFSAFIFGIMHGNLSQAAAAFAGALIFGIIAIKCNSIIPTIIIHIANNAFASYMDFANVYNWPYATEIYYGFQIVLLLVGVFILMSYGWQLRIKNDKNYALPSKKRYFKVFTNVLMLIYFGFVAFEFVESFFRANS